MNKRIRLVTATVAVHAVIDDGDTLTPVQVDPITLTPTQWQDFDLMDQLNALQAQLDSPGPKPN